MILCTMFLLVWNVDRCVLPENAGAELSRWRPAVPAQPVSFLSQSVPPLISARPVQPASDCCVYPRWRCSLWDHHYHAEHHPAAVGHPVKYKFYKWIDWRTMLDFTEELKSELKIHHTLRCPWRPLSCFWASDACLLAWLSWISISLRSPSIFFFSLRASFLLRVSDSSELWRVSTILCWFLLDCSISSSFSVSLRSISAFTWLNSSWALKIFPSSCSSEPFQCETVFKTFVQNQPYVKKR